MSNDCPYKLLGVTSGSTPAEIRSAYKHLALALHPDKAAPADRPTATVAFQKLNTAYHLLSKLFNSEPKPPNKFIFEDPNLARAYCPPAGTFNGPEFFEFYRNIFDQVYRQELNFASCSNIAAPPAPPLMGDYNCSFDFALKFYDYWFRFSTVLDFRWACDAAAERRKYNMSVQKFAVHVKENDGRMYWDYYPQLWQNCE